MEVSYWDWLPPEIHNEIHRFEHQMMLRPTLDCIVNLPPGDPDTKKIIEMKRHAMETLYNDSFYSTNCYVDFEDLYNNDSKHWDHLSFDVMSMLLRNGEYDSRFWRWIRHDRSSLSSRLFKGDMIILSIH